MVDGVMCEVIKLKTEVPFRVDLLVYDFRERVTNLAKAYTSLILFTPIF